MYKVKSTFYIILNTLYNSITPNHKILCKQNKKKSRLWKKIG